MIYILFLCLGSVGNGATCITAQFPDNFQCHNAGKVFLKRFDDSRYSDARFYCQEVRK